MSIEATNQHEPEAGRIRKDASGDHAFERWIVSVFDHPVGDSKWYWSAETAEIAPDRAVAHLTRLFRSAGTVLKPFSNPQIGQGLWYLACGACSNYMWPLVQDGLPWETRRTCICSMQHLFEQVFQPRCSHHLSHLDEPEADPLNEVCYMWWDLFPTWGSPEDQSSRLRDTAALEVISGVLRLGSVACQESALHGLGHWFPQYPEYVKGVIRGFLQQKTLLRGELREYARKACRGGVL
jgi:hypothetical protein